MGEWFLVLPAVAALIYVASVILIKKSIGAGASGRLVNLITNLVAGILFQPLWLFSEGFDAGELWRPCVTGSLFAVGQVFTFVSLRHGAVSVATPLLGTKVLLIAVFAAVLFGDHLGLKWWLGAGASAIGVILVTGAGLGAVVSRLLRADALAALGAAAFFALTDLLVQKWAVQVGVMAFIPTMFGYLALLSVGMFGRGSWTEWSQLKFDARRILLLASFLLGIQALLMAFALSLYGNATAVNIVYASRSVWSVVLAWLISKLLHRDEDGAVPGHSDSFAWRLLGALLLFAAVILVLL